MSLRCFTYMGLNPSCVVRLPGERQQQQSSSSAGSGEPQIISLVSLGISSLNGCYDWTSPTSSTHHMRMIQHKTSHAGCVERHCCAKEKKQKRDKISWIDDEVLSWQLFLNLKSKVWQNVIVALAGLIYSFLSFLAVSVRVWQRVLTAADNVPDFLCQI